MVRIAALAGCVLIVGGCASAQHGARDAAPILTQSERVSHWPVEGETRPGLWFRFDPTVAPVALDDVVGGLRIVVEHEGTNQVLTDAAFAAMVGAAGGRQTRYLYTPTSGTLFVTLELRTRTGRSYFPDTQRIELNDDCWHMVSYRVRGEPPADWLPTPPPHPRTVFLTPALSGDPPLFLDVFVSGNCFRNPLPPHE
jgi:hypothetical protein